MKRKFTLLVCLIVSQIFTTIHAEVTAIYNEPDSAYLFAYATAKSSNRNGLHFAWSRDGENWHAIGPERSFLKSDYGAWGRDKRMINPVLFKGNDSLWHCVWTLNETDATMAHAASADLVNWGRQSYPNVSAGTNCMSIEVTAEPQEYYVSWINTLNTKSDKEENYEIFISETKDFKTFTPPGRGIMPHRWNQRSGAEIAGEFHSGTLHKVSWTVIDNLIKADQLATYRTKLYGETTKEDPVRFASLKPVDATITVDASERKKISDLLIGIFFEDINYAADGGLYAELIQNRSFEYDLSDKQGRDKTWDHYKAWQLKGDGATFKIDTLLSIHENNKHYGVLEVIAPGAALGNEGFDGIPLKAGDKYNFSLFTRAFDKKGGKTLIRLVDSDGTICAESSFNVSSSSGWKKQELVLASNKTVTNAKLELIPQYAGTIALDMVSLFSQKTFKGRRNGLRADLAQVLADMKPRFVRFPGGCVAHGNGLNNMYRWKNTIGPLENRKSQRNLWNYHQTAGLGYFEYFQFCEDIGAEPVPVVAAGVPCQNSSVGGNGQQGGIPMCEMDNYIQEILDLIEWANGDVKTKWGKVRAEAGHPKPFNLKYIGIGNEDLITDIFEERFTMIYNAVKEKYPEIVVIGTVGPFSEGTDYVEGWEIATKLGVPMVDEHYYQPPGWFIHNQDYYDRYDREKSSVYLGEYAAHLPGRPNNLETALAEALYLTTLERNGDVVSMTSYAPLLAKEGFTQWNPDLIYFNNTEVKPTVGYYVQKLYGQNAGDEYLSGKVKVTTDREDVRKRVASSVIRDSATDDVIIKLVNLLPVAVKTTVKLDNITLSSSPATVTLMTGRPDDKTVKPVTSTMPVSSEFIYELPAYSFVVIRAKCITTE